MKLDLQKNPYTMLVLWRSPLRIHLVFFLFLLVPIFCTAETLKIITPKSFARLMKVAIEAKDAPAACWYLGTAQGYLRAMRETGNKKAAQLLSETKDTEGKCGGKNTLDLKSTFTPEEWARLTKLQQKIEASEL